MTMCDEMLRHDDLQLKFIVDVLFAQISLMRGGKNELFYVPNFTTYI